MALIAALAGACGGDDRPSTEVKGVHFERTTTTSLAETTTTSAPPATVAPPRLPAVDATTTTRPSAPATTTTTSRPRTRTVVERADNGGYFTYDASTGSGPAGSATSSEAANPDRLVFYAYVDGCDRDGLCRIYGDITNHGADTVGFPGGLRVKMTIRGGGVEPFIGEAHHPEHTELAPGAKAVIDGRVRVPKPGGYQYAGETTVEYAA